MKKSVFCQVMICLLINVVLACLAIFVFGTRIYVTDDNVISYLTFGIHTPATSRAYYTNVFLGWLYKHLFYIIPEFNWQTFTYYIILVFSGTVSLFAIKKHKNSYLMALWAMFMLTFFYDVYVLLTFSVVSGFVGCQGYLALFLTTEEKGNNNLMYILSGLAVLFSSMIRIESFIGISAFAFFSWIIIVFIKIKESGKSYKEILEKYVYPFAVVIGISFLVFGIDRASYSRGEWKEYKMHEDATSIITDSRTALSEEGFTAMEKEGINETMARAILGWRNNDLDILTTDVMKTINSTATEYNYFTSRRVWEEYGTMLREVFLKYREIYFALMVLIFLFVSVCRRKNIWICLIPIVLMIPFFVEFFYYAYIGRADVGECPERCVFLVLMGLSISGVIVYGILEQKDIKNKVLVGGVFTVLFLSSIVVPLGKDYSIGGLGLVDTAELNEKYGYFSNNEKIYVCDYSTREEIEESYGAWQTPPAGFLDHCIVIGGWTINHPMQNKQQLDLGCENPYRALFEKDNVYYIRKSCTDEEVLKYLRENYDKQIDMEYVKEKGNFMVFKYYLEK